MKVQVKPLRRGGARLSDYEIAALIPVDGELSVYSVGGSKKINLFDPNNQQHVALLPQIDDVELISMHGAMMLFKGTQADPQGAEKVQEWSVKIMSL